MKSIERRFVALQSKQPQLSSLMNFGTAITGQNFNKDTVHRWFNKLVDKEDYERSDKRAILRHLVSISYPEDTRNEG